ncbi:outer membrane protein assembly factor BamD [endosymbiont of unidentified scaly snail isolate Monju]|uniref:outer membrane protein assembly factor BamD n=1 Tax=endosymbiont of unidentified scaly snail isolate Monju TaxID=1248727 RepID=UPI0003892227|nr:outer membrane protein assembly factor BamD [endosymbiont of unidentified scaly snail isolate Monju]BAN68427.1 lipoprotein [endosymbiont of unidentified scaly snail isolate Monju]
MSRLLWPLLFALLLGGCSFLQDKDETKGWSQQKLYTEAQAELASGNYERAIDLYEKLEARYPFGKYAHQAQLDVAYAYYKAEEPESALAAADRFIKFHPGHPAVAYAYYLKGLVNFNRSLGILSRFLPTDLSQRDAGAALDSYKDFKEVVERFPDTDYAEDARKRMLYLRNNLARQEVHVARYYIKRGAFVAAAERGNYVIENYQRTPAVKDALEVMIEAYTRLGLNDLANDTRRVLALNLKSGAIIPDPRELEEKSWSRKLWDYFGLDKN